MHAIASKKYKKYNKSQEIQVRCTQPKGISGRAAECSLQLQARNTRNTTTIAKKQKVQYIQLKGSWMQPTPNCSSWSAELFTQLLDFISQLFIVWLLWETIRGLVAQYCPVIHLPFDSDDRFRGNFGIVQIQNGRQLFSAHYSALTSGHWWDADNWSLW